MRLTLEIPDHAAPELLRLLATLMPAAVETPADPFAGHPELPLDAEPDEAEIRWPVVEPAEPEDPTHRVFPWGGLPPAPEAPEGKMWVNRGEDWPLESIEAEGRELRYLSKGAWLLTFTFSCELPHIELIDAPVRPDRDDRPRDPNRFNA